MKKGTKKEASQLINEKIPDVTSENGSAHASTTKIPQAPPVVNTSDENSSPSDNSQNQPRETREYTDRELLAGALDSVATREEDRKKLAQYKKKAADAETSLTAHSRSFGQRKRLLRWQRRSVARSA